MKVAQINATCGVGSTGKICVAVSKLLNEKNVENYIYYVGAKSSYEQSVNYASDLKRKIETIKAHVLGNWGFNAKAMTKKLVKKLKEFAPNIVHLHNLHAHNVNLPILFNYLKQNKIKVFWTFHDCWAFTGYCPHFDMKGCKKWKVGCHHCSQKKFFSSIFDKSKKLYERKKQLFTGLDLTIITPSKWLAGLVKESFLKDYPVKVINNGINLSVFKPTASDFKGRYGLKDKHIVLSVAFDWSERKGLDVFIELSKRLDDRYKIVLVGTDDQVDKQLPNNILSIHRTQNQTELAEIYTSADVFFIATREENFPTVNLESLACGTPVITFNTGGSPETIDEKCGIVVDKNDVDASIEAIKRVCEEKVFVSEDCISRAKLFDENERFNEYVNLYAE